MAEFQEVMKQWGRLCKHERENSEAHDCEHCILGENRADVCGPYPTDYAEVADDIEEIVMQWAAEHPVVYPTWLEWLKEQGIYTGRVVITKDEIDVDVQMTGKIYNPIPADIAQKLGIEPKEG